MQENDIAVEVPKEDNRTPLEKKLDEKQTAEEQNKGNPEKKMVNIGGKDFPVVNSATVMEIVVHKLESGQELTQVVAHEFMMSDHKPYMIRLLTQAMNMVMSATKRKPLLYSVSQAVINQIKRNKPRMGDIFIGGKK